MEVLATNQKNLMTLQCEKSDYDKIFSSDKFIIFFGSNGQGKTTLASLLKNENCEKILNTMVKISKIVYIKYMKIIKNTHLMIIT